MISELDIEVRIRNKVEVFTRKNCDTPSRLYVGNDDYRELCKSPFVRRDHHTDDQTFKGLKVLNVTEKHHLEVA